MPFAHGAHVVARLADATMTVIDGESHLGGLGIAEEVIAAVMSLHGLSFDGSAGVIAPHASQ